MLLQELHEILHAPDPDGHYGVPISLAELAAANYGAAELLLKAPRQVRPAAGTAPFFCPRLLTHRPSALFWHARYCLCWTWHWC